MASLYPSLGILVRSTAALEPAASLLAFLSRLRLSPRGGRDALSLHLPRAGAIHLVHVPGSEWLFQDKEGRPPSQLRLASVTLHSSPELAMAAADQGFPLPPRGIASTIFRTKGLLSPTVSGGAPGDAAVSPAAAAAAGGRGGNKDSLGGGSGQRPRLREIVVGSEGASFSASATALAAAGVAQGPPSIWRLGGDPSPILRLIPSRYSSLVFCGHSALAAQREGHAGGEFEALENEADAPPPPRRPAAAAPEASFLSEAAAAMNARLAEHHLSAAAALLPSTPSPAAAPEGEQRRSPPPSPPPQFILHGERAGVARSGQLFLRAAALEGLDVRLCFAREASPFFNECDDTLADVVDPTMNPPAGAALKQKPLGCDSVVGMEVISGVRRGLRTTFR